ncbi:hypothetical protein M422DRAFT_276535 [Sphaerobolus stellatus SS14]|uniref:Uncharacterized protein n=1 Tax=Sphaerobolus stellatus (strain SS14) TaxID=990650 RepID=A0A0C9UC11_SPHS4|nr:hypothetical protein M422DRAFT_276897 [Sphaerobolus stellatus SS14]KIJ22974.1 hypothetical protein M422DRAFT_276535 [Sphaerobolus stellatus SS14]
MASAIARKVGLGYVEQQLKGYEPEDPLYETYVDKKGKTKRRKKDLPPEKSSSSG